MRSMAIVIPIVLAVALLLGVGTPGVANATAPSVEYSRDGGSTWSLTPPSFLFLSAVRYVPGDVATENLLIRSLRSDPTFVQLSLTNAVISDASLDAAMTIQGADAAGDGLQPTNFSALTTCQPVVPDRILTQGQIVSVSLTIRVSPTLTGQQAQEESGSFDLAVALSDPGAEIAPNGCAVNPVVIPGTGTPPSSSGQPSESAGLAYTGATLAYPALVTAAIALGIGWLFVMVSRRRRGSNDAA